MLPHNLYQMSCWMRSEARHSKPAAERSLASAFVRSDVTHDVLHETGLGGLAGSVHHATDHVTAGNGLGDRASRVECCERKIRARSGHSREEPPRHAVHRGQHHGAASKQRRDALGHRAHRRLLHRDDDEVLRRELGGCLGRDDRHREFLSVHAQAHAVRTQRGEGRTAGDRRHRVPLRAEPRADEPADGAGAEDADSHPYIMRAC
jgi:hypothetical protein